MVAFTTDVYNAYSKVLKNPIVILLYSMCFIQMVELEKKITPTLFDHLQSIFQDIVNNPSSPLVKVIAQALLWVVSVLAKYQTVVVPQVFVWVPYYIEETSANFNFSIIFSAVTLVLSSWSMIQTFVYGQLWYLYTELDDKNNKLIVLIFGIVTFVYEPFSLKVNSPLHDTISKLLVALPNISYTASNNITANSTIIK